MYEVYPTSARAAVKSSINILLLALYFALGSTLTGFATSQASAESLDKISTFAPGYVTSAFTTDMPTADFDGDGLDDVVAIGSLDHSDVIQIFGFQVGQGWTLKQSIIPEITRYSNTDQNLAVWNAADGAHLIYIARNYFGESTDISEYAGWPLTVIRRIGLENDSSITDAKVADVDRDGVYELIVATSGSNALGAYSLVTGSRLWDVAVPGPHFSALLIAQLDADPALEIVVSGLTGTVIDGATHAVEWQYEDGLGRLLESGRFGGSSPRFASLDNRLAVFQSQPWSPVWNLDIVTAQASAVADIDGDQIDELIYGSQGFPRAIRVIDMQMQTIRSTYNFEDALQIAAGNFDDDPALEIVIGRAVNDFGQRSALLVINASTGAEEFASPSVAPGPYVAGAFIPVVGGVDFVFGSFSRTEYAGSITRMDSSTGAIRWRTLAPDPTLDLYAIRDLQVVSMAGQAESVVLAAGEGPLYSSQIVALRSSDGAVLWRINSDTSALPANSGIVSIATIDLDGDALVDSILACTSEPRLRLFNVADQSQIWFSDAMTSGGCGSAVEFSSGGREQLVAVISGAVRAYDAQTHVLSWSLPFGQELLGATYIAEGVSGRELALFDSDGDITFIDVEKRTWLRKLNLSDYYPIDAVAQPSGASIHNLIVTFNGKLHIVDGVNGSILASSDALGFNAGRYNQLATYTDVEGTVLLGVGSDVAVSTYSLSGLGDTIFSNGFEAPTP